MSGTLKEQLNSITPALREMQLRKEERVKQFRAVQAQIQKNSAEIAGRSEYTDTSSTVVVNESDLSLKILEEYQNELHRLHNEKVMWLKYITEKYRREYWPVNLTYNSFSASSFCWYQKSDRLQRVEKYISTIQSLSATLGMDSSMIITKVHPSLNELSGLSKNIGDFILAKLNSTVESLETEKQKRLDKVNLRDSSLVFYPQSVEIFVHQMENFTSTCKKGQKIKNLITILW